MSLLVVESGVIEFVVIKFDVIAFAVIEIAVIEFSVIVSVVIPLGLVAASSNNAAFKSDAITNANAAASKAAASAAFIVFSSAADNAESGPVFCSKGAEFMSDGAVGCFSASESFFPASFFASGGGAAAFESVAAEASCQ